MKYKLLKDTPTIKAGTIFEEIVSMSDGTRELAVAVPGEDIPEDPQFTIQDIDNFDEWFEEMEEPTDSIYWKPNNGDEYWYIDDCAGIYRDRWDDESIHFSRYSLGLIKRTKEECEKARDRRLAEVRLRKTSDFKPDFENGKGGWIVEYDYAKHRLAAWRYPFENSGEPVRYETEEDAKKSIEENREDWLTYFGIEEN
jgi:hypothetical protein